MSIPCITYLPTYFLPTYYLPTYEYKPRFKYFLSQMTEAMINFNRNILGTEEKMIQLE